MSESRSKQTSVAEESQKSEKEAETDKYWWRKGGEPSKAVMDLYEARKPQWGTTTLPIEGSMLDVGYPLQKKNDGTERVYREFSSPEEARFFSKSYQAALKAEDSKPEQKSGQTFVPVVEDFPLDEQCFVLSPNWKPRQ